MNDLLLLATDIAVLPSAAAAVRLAEADRQSRSLVGYELRFPRALERDAVESFITGLTGLLLPWWKRWAITPFVSLEVHATDKGIRHYLIVPERWTPQIEASLQASLPSVRYEPVELPKIEVTSGAEYRLTTHQRGLRVDAAAMSGRLLASMQPLLPGELVVVQIMLTPHGPVQPARTASAGEQPFLPLGKDLVSYPEAVTALRQKQSRPLLLGVPRIAVKSATRGRDRGLLRHLESAWHESRAPGVHLTRRLISMSAAAAWVATRQLPLLAFPVTLNCAEAGAFLGWPVDALAIPGLPLGGARLVPASPAITAQGTILADSNFPGDKRPLGIGTSGRLRHVHVLGPTGTGKSTLLVNMIVQDLQRDQGLIVLDPKGDLVEAVLSRVPEHRRADVIVLDPADSARPVGFNPLMSTDVDHAEVVVENLVGLFKSLYKHSWGPRLDDILRAALLTLAGAEGTTLCEVPLILTDPAYRRRLVGRLDDPIGLEAFWGWYESISDAERQVAVGPVLNKVRAFTMRPRVRSIIGQSRPQLTMRQVLEERKVLLVSLASGLLGDEAAALMGSLVVAELWNATLARAATPAERRIPAMAYIDEWQHFLNLPTPMASVLAEARGLALGMVLAHQELGQVPEDVRRAIMANARSRVVFQLPANDARLIARELGGVLTADDLQGLAAWEAAIQIFAQGNTQTVATGLTRPMTAATTNGAAIRQLSRQRYGVPRSDVEQQIRARQTVRKDAPTGRRRRHGEGS